jgi:hypothetical protein
VVTTQNINLKESELDRAAAAAVHRVDVGLEGPRPCMIDRVVQTRNDNETGY